MKHFLGWVEPNSAEAQLAKSLDPNRFPRHIAIIMDGNGRWANQRGLPRVAGHRHGVEAVREIVEACARLELEALTIYAFSVENWKRPETEIQTLWSLLRTYLKRELPRLTEQGVQLRVIGRAQDLPADVQRDLADAAEATSSNRGLRLNVALNYGGRTEIVDAANSLIERARREGPGFRVDEHIFEEHLYTAGLPSLDLLIRTSGEFRVSNFLLWQIAYTEIWVSEKFWPEFRTADLLTAIGDYQKRDRRFGGLSQPAAEPELVGG